MAAYAALVSLMNTLEQILNHPCLSNSLDKKEAESLGEKIGFFLDFIESHNSHGSGCNEEVEGLERQIACAAHAAEDVIEFHVVDQIHAGSNQTSPTCLLDLQKIMVDMDSIKENVMKVKEERGVKDHQPTYSMPAASSRPLTTGKTTMVGFDAYLIELLDVLTRQQCSRQIISIVGMGGIGKTMLAINAYENLLIVQHFDARAWVTVFQEYTVREIILKTLSCLGVYSNGMDTNTDDELGERLYKTLSGRRYLIILDDMWDIEAWDRIKLFVPKNNNGSRIIVTTRLSDLADRFGTLKVVVNFLDQDESWNLFCERAFGQEGYPPELEEVGKKIVEKCKGLPLSIVTIGGILGKSTRTLERWENIAKDISSILNSGDNNQCLNILSLSYSHLPACLKPCFLYLGIFPEDREIHVSRLIKLWVAEGFLRPNEDQSLEEIAESYIKDLVDRNLILVHRLGADGRLKTCYIHDLLRDLCLMIAEKEKFLYFAKVLYTPHDRDREHRITIYGSTVDEGEDPQLYHTLESASVARSLIYRMPRLLSFESNLLSLVSFKSKLLRVLCLDDYPYKRYLDAAFQQVNLRFLAHDSSHFQRHWVGNYMLPLSISLMWNVQTLIIVARFHGVHAPPEIWEMPQLRHVMINGLTFSDLPPIDKQDDCVVLGNLQTLGTVMNFKCSEEVIKRMPNIKKLSISYGYLSWKSGRGSCYCLYNVARLNKLESLEYSFHEELNRENFLDNFTFPSSLRKLRLYGCELHWNDLTIMGSLPHLEVLKLRSSLIRGAEWNPVEGEFCRLKFLEIHHCPDLIYWNAEKSHFPVLENLVLRGAGKLNEIPSSIGDIPTLRCIRLNECSNSAAISTIKILEEQESLGNQSLQLKFE